MILKELQERERQTLTGFLLFTAQSQKAGLHGEAQRSAHAGLPQAVKMWAAETFKRLNNTQPSQGQRLHSAKASETTTKESLN